MTDPHLDPSAAAGHDAAPQEPQDDAQGACSWDELLYLMTHGELGTKPPPREPQH